MVGILNDMLVNKLFLKVCIRLTYCILEMIFYQLEKLRVVQI